MSMENNTGGLSSSSHSTGIPILPTLPNNVAADEVPPPRTVDPEALDDLRSELFDAVGDLGLKIEGLANQLRLALPPPTFTASPDPLSSPIASPTPGPVPTPIQSRVTGCDQDHAQHSASNLSAPPTPRSAPVTAPQASRDPPLAFYDRVNKVQKTCKDASRVEGGEYKGMGDPRSLMEWAQMVKQAPLYQFGDPITRYFFVLRNLSASVESNVLCCIELEQGYPTTFHSDADFKRHLDLVWHYLCREYTRACSGLFDYYQSLRTLQLAEPAHLNFEAHLSKFRSLIRAIQTEKRSTLDDSEISAFWYGSLTVDGKKDIQRAPSNEVRTFPLMCERARTFYDSVGKSSQHVNVTAFPSTPPTSSTPAPGRQPTTRPMTNPSAQRPGDGCNDPTVFCLDFLRQFRCQRCLTHSHSTATCPELQAAFISLRCHQCGIHHDKPVGNPAAHCAGSQCHRCGAMGHLGRACPCPAPRKRPRSEYAPATSPTPPTSSTPPGVNAVHTTTSSDRSQLQILELHVNTPGNGPSKTCPARALLDSGAEVALVSTAELERWRETGVTVDLVPDETTLVPFDGGRQCSVLGRGTVEITLDGIVIPVTIRVFPTLSHPFILPLSVFREAGGAVWVISDGHGDSLYLRHDLNKIGLNTVTTDYHESRLVANTTALEEITCDDYFDLPRDENLLDVSLVPDPTAPDGRPSISVPWLSSDRPKLNYTLAKARDLSVVRRLDPEQRRLYEDCVDSLIEDSIVVPLTGPPEQQSYYIPALPVFRDSATTPVRICLDARVLNGFIRQTSIRGRASGSLWFFLIGWRTCKYYQACDLRQAFLRVHLCKDDQPFTSSVICGRPVRYMRLPFGLNCSPHGLHSVMMWHREQWRADVAAHGGLPAQVRPLYVDSSSGTCVTPCPDVGLSGIRLSPLLTSNSSKMRAPPPPTAPPTVPTKLDIVIYVDDYQLRGETFPEVLNQHKYTTWRLRRHGSECTEEKAFNNASPSPAGNCHGMLGYVTDIGVDTVCFRYPVPSSDRTPDRLTRRQAVSLINQYYDPLALFMEGSAPSRFILADINQSAAGWDDFCNAEDTEALYEWLKTVNDQQPVPRFVDIVTNLNIFADASQLAFCVDIRGSCLPYTRLCGRYGLFPPAQRTNHTIVQKELCSLHLAVQLLAEIDVVFREHGPRPLSYTVYTDSEINLHRLRQDPARDDKLGRYERRRLRLIRSQSALLAASGVSVVIRHVGGDCNPSDVCTRRPPRGTVLRPTDPDIIHKGVLLSSDTFVFKAAPQEKCDTPLEVNLVDSIDFGVSLDTLRQAQEACGRVCAIRQRISDGEDKYHKVNDDGLVVRVTALEIPDDADTHTDVLPQILVPDAALQVRLAKAAHEFSHRGRRGTLKLLRKTYFWRKMRTTVKHVCDDCRPCQLSKFDRIAKCSLGSTMPWIGGLGPGRVCSIDFTGPYGCRDRDGHLSQDRHNFGITVTDLMTGYTRGATTPTKCSADATHALQIMFDSSDWVSVLIASDQTFRSADFRYWCQVHKISLVLLPSYSPSLMGHAERTHKDIHNYMRTVAQQSGGLEDWTTTFHRAIRVVNTCPYADSDNDGGLSPHDMHYISKARIPEIEPVDLRLGDKLYPGLDSSPPIVPTDVYEDVNAIRKQRWAQFKVGWLDRREKTRLETLRRPALPSLSPGDHVYIWQPMTRKLLWRWRGPYIVRGIDHSIVTITGRRGMEERVHLGNCRKVEAGEVEEGVTESPVDDDLLDEVDVPDQLSGAEDEPDISAESWPFGDVPNPVISPMPAEPGPTLTASPSPDPALDAKCRQVRSRIGLDVAVVEYDDDGGYKLEFGRVLALDGPLFTLQLYVQDAKSTTPISTAADCFLPTVSLNSDSVRVHDLRSSVIRVLTWRMPPTRSMVAAIDSFSI